MESLRVVSGGNQKRGGGIRADAGDRHQRWRCGAGQFGQLLAQVLRLFAQRERASAQQS